MKKLLILTAILFLFGASAYAASGDIAGVYYSTDIHTYVNGYEIDSINIGGQTLIKAEDMKYFSFSVYWDADSRTLDILENAHPGNGAPPAVMKYTQASGTPLGNYYETDIKTYLDGHEITAYNTDGITYIWAEQMRDFGYEVIWSETDRTLKITSPTRAGFKYDVFLSKGENPSSDPTSGQYYDASKGAFSILWQDGKITAKGDANLFNCGFHYNGIKYQASIAFYQNAGAFYSAALSEKLQSFVYYMYGEQLAEPADLFSYINENVKIKVNGYEGKIDNVTRGGGNGHTDFYFEITGLPQIKESDLKEIEFSIGDTSGMEEYAIERPVYPDEERRAAATAAVRKSDEDIIQSFREYEDFYAIYVRESKEWGVYKDALYTVDKETLKPSDDILKQVRAITGFCYDNIHPNNAFVGDVKTNLFFSCATAWKTGDFYYDTLTGELHTVATSTHFLPEIPDTGRKYYVIYCEGYRDNRIELAVFDADSALTMNGQILGADGYRNDIKYYLDGDKWVEFERGYERISNNATEVIDGNIDVNYTEDIQ